MAPAADSPPSSPPIATGENDLQPFFVLHKASPPRKSAAKARRRIELSPKVSDDSVEEYSDNLRSETFRSLWSKTESTINEVLRNMNTEVFDRVNKWICESFDAIQACRKIDRAVATHPYPILDGASTSTSVGVRQIFTALICTKNLEFVDDILTFVDLGVHLRSQGCYVANLTSLDFTAKNGVGGCLKALLRQFLNSTVDAPDMSILASWYIEQGNSGKPIILIIDDVERCFGSVLDDFIIMLREWFLKVPVILILGVATTIDALRKTLCSKVCSYLSLSEFTLGTPAERMNAVIEAVLIRDCDSFGIGKKVSTFLRNYFLRHDGTLTFFVRALKMAMVQHVYMEPLSLALGKTSEEVDPKEFGGENILLGKTLVKHTLENPSFLRSSHPSSNDDAWTNGLSKIKGLRKIWSSIVMCLYEVGKYHKISLLDFYCELLEPEASDQLLRCLQKGGCIHRAIQIVRDLPVAELYKLLKNWEMHTSGISEIQEKVMELLSLSFFEENRSRQDPTDASRRPTTRNNVNDKMDEAKTKEKVAKFLEYMVKECMLSTKSIPLKEIFLFSNIDKLQAALIGDPRRRIQADLLESQKFLKCSCCSKNSSAPLPSMHDTSVMYSLAQEHGDLINVHEWFHSFKAIVSPTQLQTKKRLKLSPSPKKRKDSKEILTKSDASVQAEFCRAVTELQITGLLRMPSKRRPDYVQRVAFGL